ncbi:uncharacterized protein LOC106644011 [Copidosoma floridanum]|uniref:uncharacterized protein LOC106644011 n=1 Tax=Copidosoma floridanum TaxID=29053 RepID=UPI0006C9D579|nr:uncharacterized protein LOC106644011 [Copidosoma floridanum]
MLFKVLVTCALVTFFYTWEVNAHGSLRDPPSRSSAWREKQFMFKFKPNFDDNQLYCGGKSKKNDGKCGPCGDNWNKTKPRDNENGGKYGRGIIVRNYHSGQLIDIKVHISANHLGYFEFSLCPLKSPKAIETEKCFDAHPIYLANGHRRYPLKSGVYGIVNVQAVLPKNFKCPHCVLRWHYHTGNDWGICENGIGRLGCGPQETFRGCADVSII